jgi:hypothetical protein
MLGPEQVRQHHGASLGPTISLNVGRHHKLASTTTGTEANHYYHELAHTMAREATTGDQVAAENIQPRSLP